MTYGGEILHGNNPEDWETLSILRGEQLGLYGDGMEDTYEKSLKNCEWDEVLAHSLYEVLYPNDAKENYKCTRESGKRAYAKAIRIKHRFAL